MIIVNTAALSVIIKINLLTKLIQIPTLHPQLCKQVPDPQDKCKADQPGSNPTSGNVLGTPTAGTNQGTLPWHGIYQIYWRVYQDLLNNFAFLPWIWTHTASTLYRQHWLGYEEQAQGFQHCLQLFDSSSFCSSTVLFLIKKKKSLKDIKSKCTYSRVSTWQLT